MTDYVRAAGVGVLCRVWLGFVVLLGYAVLFNLAVIAAFHYLSRMPRPFLHHGMLTCSRCNKPANPLKAAGVDSRDIDMFK